MGLCVECMDRIRCFGPIPAYNLCPLADISLWVKGNGVPCAVCGSLCFYHVLSVVIPVYKNNKVLSHVDRIVDIFSFPRKYLQCFWFKFSSLTSSMLWTPGYLLTLYFTVFSGVFLLIHVRRWPLRERSPMNCEYYWLVLWLSCDVIVKHWLKWICVFNVRSAVSAIHAKLYL